MWNTFVALYFITAGTNGRTSQNSKKNETNKSLSNDIDSNIPKDKTNGGGGNNDDNDDDDDDDSDDDDDDFNGSGDGDQRLDF